MPHAIPRPIPHSIFVFNGPDVWPDPATLDLTLVIEMRNVTSPTGLRVTANGRDITSRFGSPTTVDLDCNARRDSVVRANLQGFSEIGYTRIEASVNSGSTRLSDVKDILVYEFKPGQQRKNVVLFIGDAMGQTYRDAARLVARSVETVQEYGHAGRLF